MKRKIIFAIGIWFLLMSLLFIRTEIEIFMFFFIIAVLCFIYSRRIIFKLIAKPLIIRIVNLNNKTIELNDEIKKLETQKNEICEYILDNKNNIDEIDKNKKIINDLLNNKEKIEKSILELNEKQYSVEKNMNQKEKELKSNIAVLDDKKQLMEKFVKQEDIIYKAIEDKKKIYNILEQKNVNLLKNSEMLERQIEEYNKIIKPLKKQVDFYKKCNFQYIDSLDGWEFESFTAELLENLGYSNIIITEGSGDYGIDVVASKDSVNYAFQCKNYSQAVGNKAIQEAYSGKNYYNCHVAIVITNNYFTNSANNQAKANGVVLWDRDKLNELIKTLTN